MSTAAQTSAGVGKRVRRHDGDAFLTGRAVFTGDISLPGMLHAAVVRSPHAHAEIVAVDTTAACAAPGVVAVVSGADLAEFCDEIPHGLDAGHLGGKHAAIHPLAVDRARFVGEPVAAVIAASGADAHAAALLVDVTYTLAPAVLGAIALSRAASDISAKVASNPALAKAVAAFNASPTTAPPALRGQLRGAVGAVNSGPLGANAIPAQVPGPGGKLVPLNPLKDTAFHALGSAYSLSWIICGCAAVVAAVLTLVALGGSADDNLISADSLAEA